MTKATRWAWIISLVAVTGGVLVLAFLLAIATNNRQLYEQYYQWLFWVNMGVAVLLALVIGIAAVRLLVRVRRGKFGSRLLLKLAGIFSVVGLVPGLLIYTVSYQFASRSIESWFDVKMESALDAGLNLGRVTLDTLVGDFARKTRQAAEWWGESDGGVQPLLLERLREQFSAQDAMLVNGNGQTLAIVAGNRQASLPERPSASQLREARSQRVIAQIEGLDEDGGTPRIRAIAHVPSTRFSLAEGDHYLQFTQALPATLTANALAVQSAYREYQQRALAQGGLKRMYIGTLTLALFLAVFGAVLLAVVMGNQLARPLLLLAEGVRQVAGGDLRPTQVFASRDELGGLTRSFASMTEQLAEARAMAQRSLVELDAARTHLQTILDNLTAGVIVFSREGRIESVNPGATRILGSHLLAGQGQPLAEVAGLEEFSRQVAEQFEQHAAGEEEGAADHWQQSFQLQPPASGGREPEPVTLLVRGAWLPDQARLIVFDDITDVVSAQRSLAWGEVARRVAHEIKNPLTPIQLSAERLQHKLEHKLEGTDRQMLVRSVGTIVSQVGAMQRLVNEFRDYARLPAPQMQLVDLNGLVQEVLGLYGAAQEAGRLCFEPGGPLPPILGDASQLRQVIHNLIQNGLDAVADRQDGCVMLRTELLLQEDGSLRAVRLLLMDNGPGFPDKVLKRAFEPYVTTKTRGTGLGLAVVKKIADEHGARIRLGNLGWSDEIDGMFPAEGARVSISFSKFALTHVSLNEPGAAGTIRQEA